MGTKAEMMEMEESLIQQNDIKALKSGVVMPVNLSQLEKTEILDKTRNVFIWCLMDKELSKVTKEKIAEVIFSSKGQCHSEGRRQKYSRSV